MTSVLYDEEYRINADEFVTLGVASTKIKEALKMLGIPVDIIWRVSIVAYEAEMNIVIHGGGGTMRLEVDTDSIRVIASDKGPGIPDIKIAMQEGYSTATEKVREMGFGAGMGLPNIKRNSDDLQILSTVGEGTTVTASIKLKKV